MNHRFEQIIILIVIATNSIQAQPPQRFEPLPLEEPGPGFINFINIENGLERLNYQTIEPDTEKSSEAEALNYVTRFDGFQEYESVLTGIKGVLPYSLNQATEKEDYANQENYQINKLKYHWIRVDGYLGYRFDEDRISEAAVWYAGLRYAQSKQSRYDFYIDGVVQPPVKVTEQIKSYLLLIGYRGAEDLVYNVQKGWSKSRTKPTLKANYQIEYGIPIYNKVTRSDIPDVTFHNRNGYQMEIKLGLSYILSSVIAIDMDIYGGRLYWQGDKEPTGEIWRENKTDFVGSLLGLSITF